MIAPDIKTAVSELQALVQGATAVLPFTGAVLVLLGAVAQINPVWLFGPYQPGGISAGSVPD